MPGSWLFYSKALYVGVAAAFVLFTAAGAWAMPLACRLGGAKGGARCVFVDLAFWASVATGIYRGGTLGVLAFVTAVAGLAASMAFTLAGLATCAACVNATR